ncbi:MAG: hypothetical protein ABSF90_11340 [Syntrophobacteraceae bacterium]|jgi:DNA-binding FadR family transcriptional regulator
MSVSAVSSTDGSYQTNLQTAFTQVQNDFNQLGQALQSGDLAGAQSAFATLQQDIQNASQSQSGQQQSNWSALANALQSGDLAGAQKAFAALQTNHHHHHHSGGSQGTGSDSDGNSTINSDFNTLAQSLQSGNLTGAQQAFAALQQDIQSIGHTQGGQQTSQSSQQTSQTSQQSNPLSTLANALQSGDLAGAQQAFAALMQDAQSAAANFFNSSQTNGNIVNLTA